MRHEKNTFWWWYPEKSIESNPATPERVPSRSGMGVTELSKMSLGGWSDGDGEVDVDRIPEDIESDPKTQEGPQLDTMESLSVQMPKGKVE